MAIAQVIPVHRSLYGDGESTKVVIDFKDEIEQSKITGVPDDIRGASLDIAKVAIKSATLSGTVATVEFTEAPPEGPFTLVAELLFGKLVKTQDKAASKRG
jgi:hypothetical protein